MSRTLHSDEPDEAKSHQVLHQCNRGPCRYYTVLLTTAKTFRPFYDTTFGWSGPVYVKSRQWHQLMKEQVSSPASPGA